MNLHVWKQPIIFAPLISQNYDCYMTKIWKIFKGIKPGSRELNLFWFSSVNNEHNISSLSWDFLRNNAWASAKGEPHTTNLLLSITPHSSKPLL